MNPAGSTPDDLCQFGTAGGLGGEFSAPFAIATDSASNVYVVDDVANRVQKFSSSGVFDRAWGKNVIQSGHTNDGGDVFEVCTVAADCQIDTNTFPLTGGEMNVAEGIGTDGNDNVYVGDGVNERIQKFASDGTFDRTWGKDVNGGTVFGICTVLLSCEPGASGGQGGEMNFPTGLDTDAAGNLFVADETNNRIQKFADPIVVTPGAPPTSPTSPTGTTTGQRAAAVKKCRKKFPKGARRAKCLKRAKKLPV